MSLQILRPLLKGKAKTNSLKTHCIRGHLFTHDSIRYYKQIRRVCKICDRQRKKQSRMPKPKIVRLDCIKCGTELFYKRGTPKTIIKYCHNCRYIVNKARSLARYYKNKIKP